MILSVYGLMSKFNKSSNLETVEFSDLIAYTLNLAELLALILRLFINREPHIFEVIGFAISELFEFAPI